MAICTREWVFTHPGVQEFGAGVATEAGAALLGALPGPSPVRLSPAHSSPRRRPGSTAPWQQSGKVLPFLDSLGVAEGWVPAFPTEPSPWAEGPRDYEEKLAHCLLDTDSFTGSQLPTAWVPGRSVETPLSNPERTAIQ